MIGRGQKQRGNRERKENDRLWSRVTFFEVGVMIQLFKFEENKRKTREKKRSLLKSIEIGTTNSSRVW